MTTTDQIDGAIAGLQSTIGPDSSPRDMLIYYMALGPLLQARATLDAAVQIQSRNVSVSYLPPPPVTSPPPAPVVTFNAPPVDETQIRAVILKILAEDPRA